MKYYYCLFIGFFFVTFFSCREKYPKKADYLNSKVIEKEVRSEDGSILYTLQVSFYKDGEIKEIKRYKDNGLGTGEHLWFFPNGKLDKKIPFKNGLAQGNGYYFYDSTGTFSAHRYFRNDIPVYQGEEYWEDSIGMIKSILYINDSGKIYYKKNFDKNGNFINEEGKKK
ncbi:MAG: hypothetical protein Q8891_04620 [Bacteroidota bacterium]|nr:hypothetical protein [Bacteroidota bacterium]